MWIIITNRLRLIGCPDDLRTEVCGRLTLVNPAYAEAERMGRWQEQTPKLLRYSDVVPDGNLKVPRGFINRLFSTCRAFGVSCSCDDRRRVLPEVDTMSTVNQGCQHA